MTTRTPIVFVLCAAALALPAAASASDSTLVSTFLKVTQKFSKDAGRQASISSAPNATPKQVWAATEVERKDALAAKRAMQAEKASSAKGKQFQTLSVKAFSTYAVAERELELGITAATKGQKAAATAHTTKAKKLANQAGVLLQQAGTVGDTL